MSAKSKDSKFLCKGCEVTSDGLFLLDEVVHDRGCVFYERNNTSVKEVNLDLGLEYLAEQVPLPVVRAEPLTDWLNKKAVEGWRLITVDNGYYYFERKGRKITTVPNK